MFLPVRCSSNESRSGGLFFLSFFYYFYYNVVSHADELSLADVVSLSDLTVFHMGSFIQSEVYHSLSHINVLVSQMQ